MQNEKDMDAGRPVEEWRAVVGHEGLYEVSNFGRVKSHWGMRDVTFLKPNLDRNGYERVNLTDAERRKSKAKVHRLVCAAFHGPQGPEMHAAHIDGNKTNNCADNLRWATPAENNADQFRHGTKHIGEASPNAKLTEAEVISIRSSRLSSGKLAKRYGVSPRTISQIRNKERWAHV